VLASKSAPIVLTLVISSLESRSTIIGYSITTLKFIISTSLESRLSTIRLSYFTLTRGVKSLFNSTSNTK
jgi:hypothetical protein